MNMTVQCWISVTNCCVIRLISFYLKLKTYSMCSKLKVFSRRDVLLSPNSESEQCQCDDDILS